MFAEARARWGQHRGLHPADAARPTLRTAVRSTPPFQLTCPRDVARRSTELGLGRGTSEAMDHSRHSSRTMIVVGGEALVDLVIDPDGRSTAKLGGGPFNAARTIGRLGSERDVPRCRLA